MEYPDGARLRQATDALHALPPLVSSYEVERLRALLAEAQAGRCFVLQGGDCAETLADCRPEVIAAKLKILLQMSLVIGHASGLPVVRIGRFAGQYAKPRTSPTETRVIDGRGVTLPSYFGDLVNASAFSPEARRPDPARLLMGYHHAAATLNFVRALAEGGFADRHHPEYWDLSFLRRAAPTRHRREAYERIERAMRDAGDGATSGEARTEFYASHEGLHLEYEAALTRTVPRRAGWYDLSCHLPWIGERTRALDGAHAEFFRGVRNPIGVKLGPGADPAGVVDLCRRLDPDNEPGRLALIPRLGRAGVSRVLPELIGAVAGAGRVVLWLCDPMHANGIVTAAGVKTRAFDDVRAELEASLDIHHAMDSRLGGVHVELTGEDVTECLGGVAGVREEDLSTNYASACDPRLNYQQALEIAFVVGEKLRDFRRPDRPR